MNTTAIDDLRMIIGTNYESITHALSSRSLGCCFNWSCRKAFLKIDVDKDGKISRSEMAKCGKFNNQEVDAIFILGDVNGDGEIDLEEFKVEFREMMKYMGEKAKMQ